MGCVWGAGGGAGGGRREAGGVSRGRRAAPSCGVPSRRASSRRSSAHRGRQQRRQVSPALLDVPTDYGQGIDPPARLAPRASRRPPRALARLGDRDRCESLPSMRSRGRRGAGRSGGGVLR